MQLRSVLHQRVLKGILRLGLILFCFAACTKKNQQTNLGVNSVAPSNLTAGRWLSSPSLSPSPSPSGTPVATPSPVTNGSPGSVIELLGEVSGGMVFTRAALFISIYPSSTDPTVPGCRTQVTNANYGFLNSNLFLVEAPIVAASGAPVVGPTPTPGPVVQGVDVALGLAAEVRSLAYHEMNPCYRVGQSFSNQPITSFGGVTKYLADTNLEGYGIYFSSSSGKFAGTPRQQVLNKRVIVTRFSMLAPGAYLPNQLSQTTDLPQAEPLIISAAAGGSVGGAPTKVVYPGNEFVLISGSRIDAIKPGVEGGKPTTFTVTPALPAGLVLSNAGQISGTPAVVLGAQRSLHTVTARNSVGSAATQISVVLYPPAPTNLSYETLRATYSESTTITANIPTLRGGRPLSFSVEPALPAGLNMDPVTGTISGTPGRNRYKVTTKHKVTAFNESGYVLREIAITILPLAPREIYYFAFNDLILQETVRAIKYNSAMTMLYPRVVGGSPTLYTISPALPAGLVMDVNGAIAGRATALASAKNYKIEASNDTGKVSFSLRLEVIAAPVVSLSYPSNSYKWTALSRIEPVSPVLEQGGPLVRYAILPRLPEGLSISTSTGVISGTPKDPALTDEQAPGPMPYLVRGFDAANRAYDTEVMIQITEPPPAFNLSKNIVRLKCTSFKTEPIALVTLSSSNFLRPGQVFNLRSQQSSYSLPLTLMPLNEPQIWEVEGRYRISAEPRANSKMIDVKFWGCLDGLLAADKVTTNFELEIQNSAGVLKKSFSLEVLPVPPEKLWYGEISNNYYLPDAQRTLEKELFVDDPWMISAKTTIAAANDFKVVPTLPAGMILDARTGLISGAPVSVVSPAKDYVITAANKMGSTKLILRLTILNKLRITPAQLFLTIQRETKTFAKIENFDKKLTLSQSYSRGLRFNADGELFGIPSGVTGILGKKVTVTGQENGVITSKGSYELKVLREGVGASNISLKYKGAILSDPSSVEAEKVIGLDFGSIEVAHRKVKATPEQITREIVATNESDSGQVTLGLSSATLPNGFKFTSDPGGVILAAGQSATVRVAFAPNSEGDFSGDLTIPVVSGSYQEARIRIEGVGRARTVPLQVGNRVIENKSINYGLEVAKLAVANTVEKYQALRSSITTEPYEEELSLVNPQVGSLIIASNRMTVSQGAKLFYEAQLQVLEQKSIPTLLRQLNELLRYNWGSSRDGKLHSAVLSLFSQLKTFNSAYGFRRYLTSWGVYEVVKTLSSLNSYGKTQLRIALLSTFIHSQATVRECVLLANYFLKQASSDDEKSVLQKMVIVQFPQLFGNPESESTLASSSRLWGALLPMGSTCRIKNRILGCQQGLACGYQGVCVNEVTTEGLVCDLSHLCGGGLGCARTSQEKSGTCRRFLDLNHACGSLFYNLNEVTCGPGLACGGGLVGACVPSIRPGGACGQTGAGICENGTSCAGAAGAKTCQRPLPDNSFCNANSPPCANARSQCAGGICVPPSTVGGWCGQGVGCNSSELSCMHSPVGAAYGVCTRPSSVGGPCLTRAQCTGTLTCSAGVCQNIPGPDQRCNPSDARPCTEGACVTIAVGQNFCRTAGLLNEACGRSAAGIPCQGDQLWCVDINGSESRCQGPGQVGESCRRRTCAGDLDCVGEADPTCERKGTLNDLCGGSFNGRDCNKDLGLACIGSTAGISRCLLPAAENESCDYLRTCAAGLGCAAFNLTSLKCVRLAGLNQACEGSAGGLKCRSEFTCVTADGAMNSYCRVPASEGESCLGGAQCTGDLKCTSEGARQICRRPAGENESCLGNRGCNSTSLQCVTSGTQMTCRRLAGRAEFCEGLASGLKCQSPYACVSGVCSVVAAVGEWCNGPAPACQQGLTCRRAFVFDVSGICERNP